MFHDVQEFTEWMMAKSLEYKDTYRMLDVGTVANPIIAHLNAYTEFLIAKMATEQEVAFFEKHADPLYRVNGE